MLKPTPTLLSLGDRLLPLASRVPFKLQRLALEKGLNRIFAGPLKDGAFDMLEGRWLRLHIRDLGLSWCLTRSRTGLCIAAREQADASISGDWREFLLLASRQEDPDTLFFRRRLSIEGDTELGLAVKNLIDSLDPELLPSWLWRGLEAAGKGVVAAG